MKTTIKDVAKLAGVSIGTASKVINHKGRVAPELQAKVHAAVRELHYRPNAIARSLKSSSSRTVAILLGNITNPFQMTMAKGVEEVTYAGDYQLLISSTKEEPDVERKKLQLLHEKQVEGVIICSTGKANEEIGNLVRSNLPIVFVDRPIYRFQADNVADDCMVGMEQLVRHLYECGHRSIGVVHGDLNSIHGKMRHDAVLKALASFGLEIRPEWHVHGGFTFEGGIAAVHRLLGKPSAPTALLSANNNMTAGMMHGCRERGIRIPDDVSLVSFGGLEYNWNLITPTVSHIRQSPLEIGKKAAELLISRISGAAETAPVELLLKPAFIRGDSSANLL